MLAGRDRVHRHLVVRRRDREVDDDVDLGVLEQLVRRHRRDAELLAALLGRCRNDVGDAAHLEALEQRREAQIGGGDIAGTHDADAISLAILSSHCLDGIRWSGGQSGSHRSACRAPSTKYFALVFALAVCEQRLPVERAVADIGPAILVGLLAGRRDVLDVDGGDAAAELVHPGDRVLAGLHHPGEVHFPLHVGRSRA